MSQMVCQDNQTNIIPLRVIGCMLIVIAVLTYCLFRVIKKKPAKPSPEKPSLDDVSPGRFQGRIQTGATDANALVKIVIFKLRQTLHIFKF